MSPVLSTVAVSAQGPPLNGSSWNLRAAGIHSGSLEVINFNGSLNSLPPTLGHQLVGVRHITIEMKDAVDHPPDFCSDNTTLPELREKYGESGVSYYDSICKGIRYIQTSLFYPAIRRYTPGQPSVDQVFTPSLVGIINSQIFAPNYSLINLGSQALLNASSASGGEKPYPLTILTPPVGGQRQAYTQLACEMVAAGQHAVVTVDHSFQSGAIELDDSKVLFNLAGAVITNPRDASVARAIDLLDVARYFYNHSNTAGVPAWTSFKIDSNNTFVFGHGSGGLVAEKLISLNMFSGGGTLDNIMGMPTPYTEKNVLFRNRTSSLAHAPVLPKPQPLPEALPVPPPDPVADTVLGRLKNMALGLRRTMMNYLSGIMCRILGSCGSVLQKREIAVTDSEIDVNVAGGYYPGNKRRPLLYDDASRISDKCFYHCEMSCKPKVPHGAFPVSPGQHGHTRNTTQDQWGKDWDRYHNDPSVGDYPGRPSRSPHRHGESNCYDADYCYKLCYPKYPSSKHPEPKYPDYEDEHNGIGWDYDDHSRNHIDEPKDESPDEIADGNDGSDFHVNSEDGGDDEDDDDDGDDDDGDEDDGDDDDGDDDDGDDDDGDDDDGDDDDGDEDDEDEE